MRLSHAAHVSVDNDTQVVPESEHVSSSEVEVIVSGEGAASAGFLDIVRDARMATKQQNTRSEDQTCAPLSCTSHAGRVVGIGLIFVKNYLNGLGWEQVADQTMFSLGIPKQLGSTRHFQQILVFQQDRRQRKRRCEEQL